MAIEIAHGAGGHEEAGFAAEDFGGARLQPVDRGILAVDVVADVGFGHGAPHLRRGPRDRVAAEVDGRDGGGLALGFGDGLGCGDWIHLSSFPYLNINRRLPRNTCRISTLEQIKTRIRRILRFFQVRFEFGRHYAVDEKSAYEQTWEPHHDHSDNKS